jgi:AcrR family transcriptional regulator
MNVRSGNGRPSSPTVKATRGRPLVDDKRRLILDAALTTFADRGYHGTAVPEVATAAGVGTGTLYRYFANKEALVNEVYRDAKARLRAALLGDPTRTSTTSAGIDFKAPPAEWFADLWSRLGAFALAEPDAFRFLEMQDHAPYLDNASKHVELAVLGPLWLAGKQLRDRTDLGHSASTDVLIALVWGAFVGLFKAKRLGYLRLDAHSLQQAGEACWRMLDPQLSKSPARATKKRG